MNEIFGEEYLSEEKKHEIIAEIILCLKKNNISICIGKSILAETAECLENQKIN